MKKILFFAFFLFFALSNFYAQKTDIINVSKANPKVACNEQDSLALVALYNSTNGASWTNNDNWLTDSVYKWHGITISSSGRIVVVNLSSNNLTGSIPAEIGNLVYLQTLNLERNSLTGSIPAGIGNLSHLMFLYLYENNLSGNIPAELGLCDRLALLLLNNNNLSGEIPDEIYDLTNLQFLLLQYNKLTGTISPKINQLTNMTTFILEENGLSGILPDELGELPKIETLSLVYNKFEGNIKCITNLTTLKNLYLSHNNFSGELPDELYDLTNLEQLYLDDNLFYGKISPKIGQLNKLQFLDLSSCNFTDSIPSAFSNLQALMYLYIDDCEFADLYDFSSLPSLAYINADNNKLTFEDMEPFSSLSSYDFNPQAKVDKVEYFNPSIGSSLTLNVDVGGTHNNYQWYKDGALIGGANSDSYQIDNFSDLDKGIYRCNVTNSVIIGLTLESYNKYVGEDVPIYTVDVSVNPVSAGNINGNGSFDEGDTVILTAQANLNYHFLNWSENSSVICGNSVYEFLASESRTIVANFEENKYIIETSVLPVGSGTTKITYSINNDVSIIAIPANGYHFVNWKETDTLVTTDSVYNFKADANRTFVANFETSVNLKEQNNVFKIYPNPAVNSVFVEIYDDFSNNHVCIYDITGKKILEKDFNQNTLSLDVSGFSSGVYVIEITNNELTEKQNLIVK